LARVTSQGSDDLKPWHTGFKKTMIEKMMDRLLEKNQSLEKQVSQLKLEL